LTPEKKESEARMMWKAVKNKVVGAVGVQQAIKAIKESAGKLAEGAVVEDAVEDSLDLKSLEAHMDSEDEGDGAVKKPTGMKKLMRSLSVKMLHSARTHIGGLSPLWPVGRKEEGDVDAMFAMQYGRAKIVAVMPEFRKFVVQSDLMNFVEWGIREDEASTSLIIMIFHCRRIPWHIFALCSLLDFIQHQFVLCMILIYSWRHARLQMTGGKFLCSRLLDALPLYLFSCIDLWGVLSFSLSSMAK
jgi:hypothetical protein